MEELASGFSLLEGPTVDRRRECLLQRRDRRRRVPLVAGWSRAGGAKAARRGWHRAARGRRPGRDRARRGARERRASPARCCSLDGVTGFNDLGDRARRLRLRRRAAVHAVRRRGSRFRARSGASRWTAMPAPVAGGVAVGERDRLLARTARRIRIRLRRAAACWRGTWGPMDHSRHRVCSPRCRRGRRTASRWTRRVGYGWRPGRRGSVVRFTPDGSLDRTLDVPASFVSSLCFGGDDMRDLSTSRRATASCCAAGPTCRVCRLRRRACSQPGPQQRASRAPVPRGPGATSMRSTCHPASSRSRSRCRSWWKASAWACEARLSVSTISLCVLASESPPRGEQRGR